MANAILLSALLIGCHVETTSEATGEVAVATDATSEPPIWGPYESAEQDVDGWCGFTDRCSCKETTWCSPDTNCSRQSGVVNHSECDSRKYLNAAECQANCKTYCQSTARCRSYACTTAEDCSNAKSLLDPKDLDIP